MQKSLNIVHVQISHVNEVMKSSLLFLVYKRGKESLSSNAVKITAILHISDRKSVAAIKMQVIILVRTSVGHKGKVVTNTQWTGRLETT